MRCRGLVAAIVLLSGCSGLENVGGLGGGDQTLDAAPADTTSADTFVPIDTRLPDTFIALDTFVADTFVADTFVADTFVADTFADARDAAIDADAPPPPPFCDAANLDLVGCYRFEIDETSAQPFDQSSYVNHGTTTAVTYAAGVSGKAIVLAKGSLVKVPEDVSFDVTTQLTIEMWIKPATLPTDSSARMGLFDNDGRYGFFVYPGAVVRATAPTALDTPSGAVTIGVWQHVAYTYDGKVQVLYVNGVAVASRTLAGATFTGGSGDGVTIGGNSGSGGADTFEGSIDSLRVFRVARSATQICQAAGKC